MNKQAEHDLIAGLQIKSLADVETKIKMLVYGFPGVGKSHLAGTASEVEAMLPILWIDTEKGTRTIRGRQGIDVVEIENVYDESGRLTRHAWQQMADVIELLRTDNRTNYRTLVIDNISECQRIAMDWVMTAMLQTAPNRDPLVPDRREWGKSSELLMRLGTQLRDIDMHVLMTAHAKEVTNDAGAVIRTTLALPGQLADKFPGLVDLVGFLYTKEIDGKTERILMTDAAERFCAKDRSGVLDSLLVAPSMTNIHQALA